MEKTKVLEVLRNNDSPQKQYNDLLQLFIKHPHHGPSLAKYYNASGFSKANLETLKYDIKQTYGIKDAEVRAFVPEKKEVQTKAHDPMKLEVIKTMLSVDFESLNYNKKLKPAAITVSEYFGDELPDMKKVTLIEYLNKFKSKLIEVSSEEVSANPYIEAPADAKDGLKLRQEFPFLSEADCPDKMKILVADKFTALQNFEAASTEIQEACKAGKTEGLFELGKKAVENFELNQAIYDELNYYQEHKQILGNHPIFADEVLVKKVDAYSTQEAMKRQGNLRSYISRETPKLEKMAADKKEKAEAKIKGWQDELNLIDARLNEADKK